MKLPLPFLNPSFAILVKMVCSSQNRQNSPIWVWIDSQNRWNSLVSAGTYLSSSESGASFKFYLFIFHFKSLKSLQWRALVFYLHNPVWWLVTVKSYFMGITQTPTTSNKNLMGVSIAYFSYHTCDLILEIWATQTRNFTYPIHRSIYRWREWEGGSHAIHWYTTETTCPMHKIHVHAHCGSPKQETWHTLFIDR